MIYYIELKNHTKGFVRELGGIFTVFFSKILKEPIYIEIYNMLGQKAYNVSVNSVKEYPIELNYLSKGTYLLKVVSENIDSNIKISIK